MSLKSILQGRKLAHPLHPLLVHFPIGLWAGSLLFDIVSMSVADPALGHSFVIASYYCILTGVIMGGLAAIAGFADFLDIPAGTKPHPIAVSHMTINVFLMIGYVIQLIFRDTHAAAVEPGFFILNLVEILFLGVSGYLGSKLVFTHRVGSRSLELPTGVSESNKPRRIA